MLSLRKGTAFGPIYSDLISKITEQEINVACIYM